MTNIPYVAAISFLFVGISAFRVLPAHENPDLIIDDELNLVEPKRDFWNILLRPKGKTTFKRILKMLNTFDTRDRYSVGDEPAPALTHQPEPVPADIVVVKKDEVTVKKGQEQVVLSAGADANIVSGELSDRESLSEEHPIRIALGSISMETNEKSDESNQSPKTIKNGSSQDSENSRESLDNDSSSQPGGSPHFGGLPQTGGPFKLEKPSHREPSRYYADIPKSLHHFDADKPRFQHSFRNGWVY